MMILPEAKDIQTLDVDKSAKEFLCFFLAIVRKYPQNRMLLFAWIFCAYELGVSTRLLGFTITHKWLGWLAGGTGATYQQYRSSAASHAR